MLSTSSLADAPASNAELNRLDATSEGKKKKKKKRSHDEATVEDVDDTANPEKKKKKKRKHAEASTEDEPVEAAPQLPNGNEVENLEEPSVSKKKKKIKDKGKGKSKEVAPLPAPDAVPLPSDEDAEMDAQAQSAATALLNAIVAAVAGATAQEEEQARSAAVPASQPQQFQPVLPQAQHQPAPSAPFLPSFPLPPGFPVPGFGDASVPGGGFMPNLPPHIFNELAYGSSDDLIRSLQDLDVSKLAGALKTLGDAGATPNAPPSVPSLPLPPAFVPQPLPPPTQPLQQKPAGSSSILGRPGRTNAPALASNVPPPGNSLIQHQTQSNHADILSTKWLSAAKLAELVETEGLVYKKGKFSATEDQQIVKAVEEWQKQYQYSDSQLNDLIFSKNDKQRDKEFWTTLTRAVPQRPIIAVYHHVRRIYHPLKKQGAWTAEQDAELRQAVADLGQQWEKVGYRIGRMSSDCRDRYRNHLHNRDIRVTGPWSKEEEEELTQIVTDMTVKQGRDFDNDVFWGKVSELMGGRRGRQQCRIKWTDSLSKIVKSGGEGQKPRWNQQDAYILVHKVDSLNVHDDTEIDWKTLPDPDWNLWSAHTLQRRWLTMKKSIKGYEDMSHQEIMDILRVKKAHSPESSAQGGRKRKGRKIVSATTITEDGTIQFADAGSSTGPGTFVHGQMLGRIL